MKFFKSMFGSKKKQNSKFEPNTLAEANGSPDLRLATNKEKEADIPVIKQAEVKKIPKKSDRTASEKSKNEAKAAATEQVATATAVKKTVEKSAVSETKSTKSQPVSEEKKTAVSTKSTATKVPVSVANSDKSTDKKAAGKPVLEAKKPKAKATESVGAKPADTATAAAKMTKSATATKSKPGDNQPHEAADTAKKSAKNTSDLPQPDEEITVSKNGRNGKFEIKKSKDGRFVFNLYASNSVIVATSQVYSSSTSAMNGIKSVITNAATAPVEDQTLKTVTPVPFPKWEIYLDKGEQYRFRLCASNGSCVCHSQGYTSKANCKKGIESIIKFAADAEITKAYLEKKDK